MQFYQLKITLNNVTPPVWRRVAVPANLSFSQLAYVFNTVMGWCGYHLFMFTFYRDMLEIEEESPDYPFEEMWDDRERLEAKRTCIGDILDEDVKSFTYIYDFGDDWHHTVKVEKVLDLDKNCSQLLKYKGECPKEDCGGPWGYRTLVETLSNPEDPEYEDMMEWSQGKATMDFDPEDVQQWLNETAFSGKKSKPLSYYEIDNQVMGGRGFSEIRFPGHKNGSGNSGSNLDGYRTLSEEDGQLFYRLWFPLLDYVNDKYKVNRKIGLLTGAPSLDPEEVKKIADKLWSSPLLIDRYLQLHKELPEEHREIIRSWKRCISGMFILERHLKKGSILIGGKEEGDQDQVYQVVGTISPFPEMFPKEYLPLAINATLLPFRDVIITDGLNMLYQIQIGGNMKEGFKDTYRKAKAEGKIITQL